MRPAYPYANKQVQGLNELLALFSFGEQDDWMILYSNQTGRISLFPVLALREAKKE